MPAICTFLIGFLPLFSAPTAPLRAAWSRCVLCIQAVRHAVVSFLPPIPPAGLDRGGRAPTSSDGPDFKTLGCEGACPFFVENSSLSSFFFRALLSLMPPSHHRFSITSARSLPLLHPEVDCLSRSSPGRQCTNLVQSVFRADSIAPGQSLFFSRTQN